MGLSHFFGGTSGFPDPQTGEAFDPSIAPSAIPAGFQSILQFSTLLLQRVLSSNLSHSGLATLSARVPFQAELVTPKLRAAIQSHWTLQDQIQVREPYVEVLLTDARLQTLRSSSTPPSRGRVVDLAWTLQVNLFKTPGLTEVFEEFHRSRSGGIRGTVANQGQVVGDLSVSIGEVSSPKLPKGDRLTLTQGTVLMHVPTDLREFPSRLQFYLTLNFDGVQPVYKSDDPILIEFLESSLATDMLAQAVAPLRTYRVPISPSIALAGNLNSSQVASMQLPSMHIQELVVLDKVDEVLALCVELGDESTGVTSMVHSFLNKHDFAYYISDRIFGPTLAVRWRANAIYAPIVNDIPVELPVERGSEETGKGIARVEVNISDVLKESGIEVSMNNGLGDPLQLVAEQKIHLLRLWLPNGDEVNDLGELGIPTTQPFPLSIQLFDKLPNTQGSLHPLMEKFLAALLLPIYVPMLERFSIKEISGFTSSAMRSIVVRWNLKSPLDLIVFDPEGGGVIAEI